jgi:hypothetical protein
LSLMLLLKRVDKVDYYNYLKVCVVVCVLEREREREIDKDNSI